MILAARASGTDRRVMPWTGLLASGVPLADARVSILLLELNYRLSEPHLQAASFVDRQTVFAHELLPPDCTAGSWYYQRTIYSLHPARSVPFLTECINNWLFEKTSGE